MDFWVWIVILVIAWLLEALGSQMKKKRERKVFLPDALVELSDALVERRDEEEPPLLIEVPVRRTAQRPRDEEVAEKPLEGVSAEVVDRAEATTSESAEPQHVRAMGKYGPSQVAAVERVAPRRRLVLRPATLRDAVLWTEILGRPRGGW